MGNADIYFYEKPGTKRWDTCAGEALLESVGGYLTDIDGQAYKYFCKLFINKIPIMKKNLLIPKD